MDLTPADIHEKQFHDQWRGYNQREVDDFLDRVAEAIDRLQRENADLQTRVTELDQAMAASRDTEDMLKKTLVTAQRAAEQAIASAKHKADELVANAQEQVKRSEAESRDRLARTEAESRRRAAEAETELDNKRRNLDGSIEKLRAIEGDTRQRLKAFLEQQLRALESLGGGEPSKIAARPAVTRPGETRPQPAVAPQQPGAQPATTPQQTPGGQPAPAHEQQSWSGRPPPA